MDQISSIRTFLCALHLASLVFAYPQVPAAVTSATPAVNGDGAASSGAGDGTPMSAYTALNGGIINPKPNNGAPLRTGEVLENTGSDLCNGIYGVNQQGDLPWVRANRGRLMFYGKGEGNTPDGLSDQWVDQGGIDDPKQSACGIPHNAYYISHVAIHPYWLKYAPLDRYCMPDVCISFWHPNWQVDMMLKVTDICSTDPSKSNSCKDPGDIKIDRTKGKIWGGLGGDPRPAEQIPGYDGDGGDETIWFFRKCWDDGMLQEAYDHDGNWFAQPKYFNNLNETGDFEVAQYTVNQALYPPQWQHNQCGYNTSCTGDPITDYNVGDPLPSWEPICGGRGFSGNTAPATRCPDYTKLGTGGTADASGSDAESTQCQSVAQQVASGGNAQGSFKGNT